MSQVQHELDRARVRRILRGDHAAFRQLFDQYFPGLYRFALSRLQNEADAADLVQQTFCRAIENLDGYRGEAALYTWFSRICSNLIADHYRHQAREVRQVVHIEDHPEIQAVLAALTDPGGEGGEADLVRRDVGRLVQATLDHLPEHYGDVLEWKYVDELPVAEIASRLRISLKATESLLGRSRQAFRQALVALAGTDGFPGTAPDPQRQG